MDYNTNEIAIQDNRSQTSKPKWTALEERQLARLQLGLPTSLLQKDIIAQLAKMHTGRSAEGIKKQRQKSSYKEVMNELSNDITGVHPLDIYGQTLMKLSHHHKSLVIKTALPSIVTPSTSSLLAHQNIHTFIKELSVWCSEPIQTLVKSLDNNNFEQFDRLFTIALTSHLSQSSTSHKLIRKKLMSDNKKRQRNRRWKFKNSESQAGGSIRP